MKRLLKYSGNAVRNPENALQEMTRDAFEFVTWGNLSTGDQFIAKKSTLEKMAHNQSCLKRIDHLQIEENEVIKISDVNLTIDEIKLELDAKGSDEITIKEGFRKVPTKVSRAKINMLEQVLYNPDFDCSTLFIAVKP